MMVAFFTHLLAKGTKDPERPDPRCTLLAHTMETVHTAEGIVGVAGERALLSLGLPGDDWRARLRRAAALAAFLHDLGKANDHFQQMLRLPRGSSGFEQAHRHELLSLWLAGADGPLGGWLFAGADDVVQAAVLCAVGGHHLKFADDSALAYGDRARQPLTLLGDHLDFARTLSAGSTHLSLGAPPDIGRTVFDNYDHQLQNVCRPSLSWLRRTFRESGREEWRRFVGAVKAMVLSADIIASAIVRHRPMREQPDGVGGLAATLTATCTSADLRAVASKRLGGHEARPFQRATAASSEAVTLVRAGCGTGKTVAAYLWASRQGAGRKLFVCYPTTGTATEGFRDYVADEAIDAILFHGRAEVDLEFMQSGEPRDDDPAKDMAEQWAAHKALRLWPEPIVICTADTVLGLMQNYRGGLIAFPAIAGGAFVFDEIHQYDDRMFSALHRFIAEFRGAPVLLMTASLQGHRLELLQDAVHIRGGALAVVAGPKDLEVGQRYTLHLGARDAAVAKTEHTLSHGGKVLWVCNTVDAAIIAAGSFSGAGALTSVTPLVYHSHFRYEDRARRHREVVNVFDVGKNPGAALAITTQVCEVSLDLSADLLVSEIAPVPSMIQRLGRLNRRFNPDEPGTRAAIFLEPGSHLPYTPDVVDLGRKWLDRLGDQPCSQRDLAEAFEVLAVPQAGTVPVEHAWLDTLPYALPAPLRELDPSILIVLAHEAHACRDERGSPISNEIVRRSIPMNLGRVASEFTCWSRIGMAFVPPAERVRYSKERGAQWVQGGGR